MPSPAALDAEALSAAYREHAAERFGFCLARLGDRHAAQDAVQETFLRLWQAAERYDPDVAGIRTWLYAVARNVVIDQHRRRTSGIGPVNLVADITPLVDGPSRDLVDARLDAIVVEEALSRLTPEHRHVILECYLRDRPAAEVAATLGIPHGTVRSRIFHALKALRVELDQIGGVR